MEVRDALERLGGVSHRQDLLRLCSRRALDAALAEGSVIRVSRNRYVLEAADEARVAAARVHGVVSHLSAALVHGWKVKVPPRRPSVTVRRNRGRIDDRGIDLRWSTLTPAERAAGVTDPVRTVVDCARTLPFDEALAVADSALRSSTVDRSRLIEAASLAPRTGRAAALRVAHAADGRAANPFESVLRAIALDVPGLHVVPQGAVGAIGQADLADTRLRIAVEAESFEFHALAEAFRHDVRRYTAMTRLGWLVVRFVWDDVMHRPAYVHDVLADIVALRSCEQAVHCPPGAALAR
jgi:very-short-patch-repair endonuclease